MYATISTGYQTGGLWVCEGLYGAICQEGGAHRADEEAALVRIVQVDEEGILLDTFQGDILLRFNFQDATTSDRFSMGRISKEWNDVMVEFAGCRYHPVKMPVTRVGYGQFLIPHPRPKRFDQ